MQKKRNSWKNAMTTDHPGTEKSPLKTTTSTLLRSMTTQRRSTCLKAKSKQKGKSFQTCFCSAMKSKQSDTSSTINKWKNSGFTTRSSLKKIPEENNRIVMLNLNVCWPPKRFKIPSTTLNSPVTCSTKTKLSTVSQPSNTRKTRVFTSKTIYNLPARERIMQNQSEST